MEIGLSDQLLSGEENLYVQTEQAAEIDPNTCPICFLSKPLVVLEACVHGFCESCLKFDLELKISEGLVMNVVCPTCGVEISEDVIKSLVSEKKYSQYSELLKVKRLELDIYVKWCPIADCKGYDVASDENRNLTCNQCGQKYCYGCSQAWHKGRCKDNREISFRLWSMANGVKICPRCKNSVQKNGGCRHMTCPRCHYQWCWICGKNYNSVHSDFECLIGKSYFDLNWFIIVFLLFFPVMMLFIFFFVVVYFYQTEVNMRRFTGVFKILRKRWIVFPVSFCLSPAVEILILAGLLVSIAIACAVSTSKFSCLRFLGGVLLSALAFCLGVIVLALLVVIAPLVGLFFLVTKIFFVVKRCFKPNQAIEYPRLII